MEQNIEFNAGDRVYHKSDSSIIWVIERIEKEKSEAHCSTLNGSTKELKRERFALITLAKVEEEKPRETIIFGTPRNRHSY